MKSSLVFRLFIIFCVVHFSWIQPAFSGWIGRVYIPSVGGSSGSEDSDSEREDSDFDSDADSDSDEPSPEEIKQNLANDLNSYLRLADVAHDLKTQAQNLLTLVNSTPVSNSDQFSKLKNQSIILQNRIEKYRSTLKTVLSIANSTLYFYVDPNLGSWNVMVPEEIRKMTAPLVESYLTSSSVEFESAAKPVEDAMNKYSFFSVQIGKENKELSRMNTEKINIETKIKQKEDGSGTCGLEFLPFCRNRQQKKIQVLKKSLDEKMRQIEDQNSKIKDLQEESSRFLQFIAFNRALT